MDSMLTLVYLPTAIVLGTLHALEPGHAKTLTAAYLIGVKGTRRDAALLGISVAATHSIVVILLSISALWLGREAFTDKAMYWLQMISGGIVVLLGFWLLWRRWPRHGAHGHHHHHGAPDPVEIKARLVRGRAVIVATPDGERMTFASDSALPPGASLTVRIRRAGGVVEELPLACHPGRPTEFMSASAPAEPHEFQATLDVAVADGRESCPFAMHEPEGHGHSHDDMDEDEHARAHAASMPAYVARGERPTAWQIITFGAAGGLIPCPASVTVMLLALSTNAFLWGVLTVMCFSLGLAIALVGIGLAVVAGLGQLAKTGKFEWVSRHAPLVSAGVVVLSGVMALLLAH